MNIKIHKTAKRIAMLSLTLLVLLLGTQLIYANILPARIYVTVGGAGLKNGTSWSNAIDSTAFRTILPKALSGDTFWVAAGIYHPDLSNDTNKFEVPIDVCLYGGFAGNETSLSQRNVRKNRTIFDGAGHIYNVVYLNNVTSTTVFDGFTVINGNNPASGTGGLKGLYAGGAIFYSSNSNGGNPQIANDSFANNYAANDGGAIYNYGNFDANATIINCSFINNSVGAGGIGGGAIAIFSVNYGEAYTPIINCFFKGNTSANYGGAIVNYSSVGYYCYPVIANCVFISNSAVNDGAAIYSGMNNGVNSVDPTISNCSFANNTAGINNTAIYNDNSSRPSILNCILWDGSAAEISDNNGAYSTVYNSDIYGGWQGNGSNNISSNPLYINVAKDSLQLALGSFAINAGNNQDTVMGVETDIAGNARIQQGTIDMGAYESPYASITHYYVTPGGKGNKGGSSWANAMDSINFRSNISGAAYGDTFWVAAGVYHPDLSSPSNHFIIPSGVALYGGFAGAETKLSQRKIHTNITALDGNGYINSIIYMNSADSTTVLDGFTVSNGFDYNRNASIYGYEAGGGMFIDGSSGTCKPVISNDSFVNNNTYTGGGAIFNYQSSPTIISCSFVNNVTTGAKYGGAAIGSDADNSVAVSSPIITNCTFVNNRANNNGGVIGNYTIGNGVCSPFFTNCSFNGNTASSGGVIFDNVNNGNILPVFNRCVFNNNTAGTGAIEYSYGYGNSGTYHFSATNCLFSNNMPNSGGVIYHSSSATYSKWSHFTNCTFAGNGPSGTGMPLIYNYESDSTVLINCILWDSTTVTISDNRNSHSVLNNCDVYGGWKGNGSNNINANPLFKNAAKGDYSILTCSPAFNTATATGAPATDILGHSRPALGGYDMGAYEAQALSPVDTVSFGTGTIKSNGGSVTLKVKFTGTAPWIFTYTDGVNTYGPDTAKASPYSLTVNPLFTTVYTINSFMAPIGTCTVLGKVIADTVRLTPRTRFYVTPAGAGTKTGTSWANAMDSTIFRNNIALALYHDTFWIAQGVYHPNLSSANNSFTIPSGVALYGGFTGTETAISQSRPRKNITALDGAHFINNIVYFKSVDSTTVLAGFTISNGYNSNDNNGNGGIGANFWGAAILNDGSLVNSKPLIANDSFVNNFADNDGGAISNTDGSPTIINCAFVNNSTYGDDEGGGAIFNYTSNNNSTAIIIKGCRFINNNTGDDGGAICNYNDNVNMNVKITNSLFRNNVAYDGGALYNKNYGNLQSVDMVNCIFFNNASNDGEGAAIYNRYNTQTVWNCTFANNYSVTSNGTQTINDNRSVSDTIINSIFWDKTPVEVYAGSRSIDTLSYNDIQGGWTGKGSNNVSGYPMFTDTAIGNVNITSCSPAFNTATAIGAPAKDILGNPRPALGGYDMGALELQTLTPIDTVQFITGTVKSTGGNVTLKIRFTGTAPWYFSYTDGVHNYGPIKATASPYSLVVNPIFNTVYTLTGLISPTGVCANYGGHSTDTVNVTPRTRYYVTPGGAGLKSGSSWANAIDSVQFRNNLFYTPYHDTFWVAKGVYHTDMSSQDNSFVIPSGVAVYGGFAGTETAISQRKLHTNISMLDGAGFTENIVYFNGADSTSVLNGFTVANGYNSTGDGGKQGMYSGAAVFVDGSTLKCNPQITNDSFVNNAASSDGGAVYLFNNAGAYIANCSFTNNYTNANDYGGAALFCLNNTSAAAKPVITNCTFSGNTSNNNGGAIGTYSNGSTINPTITACKFIDNAATYGVGGAVYFYTPNVIDSPTFINCVFFNNSATNNNTGYDIFIDGMDNMVITNCTFSQNGGATVNNSIFLNGQDTTKITNSIFWDNSNYELEYNNSSNAYYTVNYSDMFNGWTGAGSNNITANPLFVDSAAGNLQLLPCSPAINTGTATGAPSVDILGNPRPTLGGYDMGAYQIQTAGLKPGVTALSHFCNGSSASIRADISGATSYQWQDSTASGHWTNITNTTPYTGATSDTLNITSVTNALNGYAYRCLVTVSCGNYISDSLIIKVSSPTSSVTSAGACSDKLPYIWNGQSYNTAGIDTVYLVNKNGCDSMAILHLAIHNASTSTTTTSVCSNHLPYKWNGKNYNSSGIDTVYLTNKIGCDSITVLDLTINSAPDTTVRFNSGTLTAVDSVGVTYQWINCATLAPVTGATNRSFKPVKTGHYAVIVMASPCTDTSSCHYVIGTGLDNVYALSSDITVYPNPANNTITIHIDNYTAEQIIRISDISGRLVYTGTLTHADTQLDLTNYSSGMYMYTIYGETNKATGKIIVQH